MKRLISLFVFCLLLFSGISTDAKKIDVTLNVDQSNIDNCTTQLVNTFTETQINLYPNPNNGLFDIQIIGEVGESGLNLKIANTKGQIVQEQIVNFIGTGQTITVNLSGRSGMCFIFLSDDNAYYISKVFIK